MNTLTRFIMTLCIGAFFVAAVGFLRLAIAAQASETVPTLMIGAFVMAMFGAVFGWIEVRFRW